MIENISIGLETIYSITKVLRKAYPWIIHKIMAMCPILFRFQRDAKFFNSFYQLTIHLIFLRSLQPQLNFMKISNLARE